METEFDLEENSADELMSLAEFIEHFNVHYKLLLRRYKRFKEIDDVFNTDIDVITYLKAKGFLFDETAPYDFFDMKG